MNSNLILIVVINFIFVRGRCRGTTQESTTPSEQKYFVVIRYQLTLTTCGGAIITPHFVLTTDGCVQYDKKLYSLHFGGDFHLNSVIRKIEKVYAYSVKEPNCPALVQTNDEITFGEKIALQTNISLAHNKIVGMTFGKAAYRNGGPKFVQFYVPTVEFDDINCVIALDKAGLRPPDRCFCTRLVEFGNILCMGEEGDPLIYDQLLVGIASKQFGCDTVDDTSIFFNVAYYASWIESTTKN